jgi:hypothetical protein
MSGWLCQGVNAGTNNNAPSEAQLFFQQFSSTSQSAGLSVNGVVGCPTFEQIEGTGTTVSINGTSYSAPTAIIDDMLGQGSANSSLSCYALKRQ